MSYLERILPSALHRDAPGGRRGSDEAVPDLGEVFSVVGELDLGVTAGKRGYGALVCRSIDF